MEATEDDESRRPAQPDETRDADMRGTLDKLISIVGLILAVVLIIKNKLKL